MPNGCQFGYLISYKTDFLPMWFWFWSNNKNRGWGGRRPTTKCQPRFFTRRTKSVGCIASMFGFDWTSHRVDKLNETSSNRMITTTDASLRSEGFHFTVHSLRSFHWSSSLLFFKCHRVNKSGEPIRYKIMAPHFRVWSNPERDRRFSPTHNWSTVKKVDCSQVGSCFKS